VVVESGDQELIHNKMMKIEAAAELVVAKSRADGEGASGASLAAPNIDVPPIRPHYSPFLRLPYVGSGGIP
jgi:hypothetical protein